MPTISLPRLRQIEAFDARIRAALASNPALGESLKEFWNFLQASETMFIDEMNGQPVPPRIHGEAEWGPALYLLHHLPWPLPEALNWLGMPPTAITSADIAKWESDLEGPGIVGSDGTLYGFSKYAAFDPEWAFAPYLYIVYKTIESPQSFGANPPAVVNVTGGDSLTIALAGDWGTGVWQDGSQPACPSQAVMEQIQALEPDLAIHLGDVYYAGTQPDLVDFESNEEQKNLVDLWPGAPAFPKGSFTLNSNHEMYGGAEGYFNVALRSPLFAAQNGNSYFAIKWGGYLILGLDSAYYDKSELYMDGALTDAAQIAFVKSQASAPDVKTIIVMTHHNGITTDGTKQMPLFAQVTNAIGRAPDYWYWGHVHNGIAYSAQSAAGAGTKCRCLGHAALPFGNAPELHDSEGNNIPTVDYYTHTPLGSSDPNLANRVKNGFAVLTLTAAELSEVWYDQTGDVAWRSPSEGKQPS